MYTYMIICIVGTWRSPYTATQIVAIGKTFDTVPFMNYIAYIWLLSEFTDKRWYPVGLCDFNALNVVGWFSGPLNPLWQQVPNLAHGSSRNAQKKKQQGDKSIKGVNLMLRPHSTTSTRLPVFLERSKIKIYSSL